MNELPGSSRLNVHFPRILKALCVLVIAWTFAHGLHSRALHLHRHWDNHTMYGLNIPHFEVGRAALAGHFGSIGNSVDAYFATAAQWERLGLTKIPDVTSIPPPQTFRPHYWSTDTPGYGYLCALIWSISGTPSLIDLAVGRLFLDTAAMVWLLVVLLRSLGLPWGTVAFWALYTYIPAHALLGYPDRAYFQVLVVVPIIVFALLAVRLNSMWGQCGGSRVRFVGFGAAMGAFVGLFSWIRASMVLSPYVMLLAIFLPRFPKALRIMVVAFAASYSLTFLVPLQTLSRQDSLPVSIGILQRFATPYLAKYGFVYDDVTAGRTRTMINETYKRVPTEALRLLAYIVDLQWKDPRVVPELLSSVARSFAFHKYTPEGMTEFWGTLPNRLPSNVHGNLHLFALPLALLAWWVAHRSGQVSPALVLSLLVPAAAAPILPSLGSFSELRYGLSLSLLYAFIAAFSCGVLVEAALTGFTSLSRSMLKVKSEGGTTSWPS